MLSSLLPFAVFFLAAEADWPQFRGPTADGIAAAAADPPVEWSETKNIRWKVEIPGCARSSPVVLGDRIYLTTAEPKGVERKKIGWDDMQTAESVVQGAVCLDRATGKQLWQTTLFEKEKPEPVHWLNSWATPTPVAEPGRLYCDFGAFGTACLDAESGKILWTRTLPVDHQVGPGSSPAVYENLLILVRDGRDAQYLAALDKRTGEEVWRTDRPPIAGDRTDMKKSFSTPLIFTADGQTQMVVPCAHWVISYDPKSGKELWRARHGEGFSLAARPLFGNGLVYICTGCISKQWLAVRVDGHGDVTETHIAWRVKGTVPSMATPILVGKELFAATDDGIACCLDALSGEILWRQRLGGSFLASPVLAAGRLYFVNREGKATVIEAQRQFVRLAENTLPGPVVASPAVVGRAIYLRSDTCLYCIEAPQ